MSATPRTAVVKTDEGDFRGDALPLPERFVIFDTTPLLPFADAHYLSRMVDSILFVVRQNYTPFNKIKESLNMLEKKKVIGFICNDIDDSSTMSGYYNYYRYNN